MGKRLFVGSLPYETTEEQVRQAFSAAGKVQSVKLIIDRETNRSKGFAFVEMATDAEAAAAVTKLNNSMIGTRRIVVNEARPMGAPRPAGAPGGFRPSGPPSGGPGGGFGGPPPSGFGADKGPGGRARGPGGRVRKDEWERKDKEGRTSGKPKADEPQRRNKNNFFTEDDDAGGPDEELF